MSFVCRAALQATKGERRGRQACSRELAREQPGGNLKPADN